MAGAIAVSPCSTTLVYARPQGHGASGKDGRDDHDARGHYGGDHGDRDNRSRGAWSVRVQGGDDTSIRWSLDASGNWYDFVVTCDADTAFYRRFAGRVETGRHSVSDPAMGLADRF